MAYILAAHTRSRRLLRSDSCFVIPDGESTVDDVAGDGAGDGVFAVASGDCASTVSEGVGLAGADFFTRFLPRSLSRR